MNTIADKVRAEAMRARSDAGSAMRAPGGRAADAAWRAQSAVRARAVRPITSASGPEPAASRVPSRESTNPQNNSKIV